MPAEVQSAPVTVQQAYQFAIANPDVMKQIPCYYGYGDIGHTSNYSCYVAGVDDKGVVSYDNHALGCSLCVDITLDTISVNPGEPITSELISTDVVHGLYANIYDVSVTVDPGHPGTPITMTTKWLSAPVVEVGGVPGRKRGDLSLCWHSFGFDAESNQTRIIGRARG